MRLTASILTDRSRPCVDGKSCNRRRIACLRCRGEVIAHFRFGTECFSLIDRKSDAVHAGSCGRVYPVRKVLLEICVGVPLGKNVPAPVTSPSIKGYLAPLPWCR